jgi:hypothetical protein
VFPGFGLRPRFRAYGRAPTFPGAAARARASCPQRERLSTGAGRRHYWMVRAGCPQERPRRRREGGNCRCSPVMLKPGVPRVHEWTIHVVWGGLAASITRQIPPGPPEVRISAVGSRSTSPVPTVVRARQLCAIPRGEVRLRWSGWPRDRGDQRALDLVEVSVDDRIRLKSGPRTPRAGRHAVEVRANGPFVLLSGPFLSVLAGSVETGGPPVHERDFRSGWGCGSGSGLRLAPELSVVVGRLETGGRRPSVRSCPQVWTDLGMNRTVVLNARWFGP